MASLHSRLTRRRRGPVRDRGRRAARSAGRRGEPGRRRRDRPPARSIRSSCRSIRTTIWSRSPVARSAPPARSCIWAAACSIRRAAPCAARAWRSGSATRSACITIPRDSSGPADPNFQGFGSTTVAEDGAYRFRTIEPVPYPGRTPHIHFRILAPGLEPLVTQMYVAGQPLNSEDGLYQRLGERALAGDGRPRACAGSGAAGQERRQARAVRHRARPEWRAPRRLIADSRSRRSISDPGASLRQLSEGGLPVLVLRSPCAGGTISAGSGARTAGARASSRGRKSLTPVQASAGSR